MATQVSFPQWLLDRQYEVRVPFRWFRNRLTSRKLDESRSWAQTKTFLDRIIGTQGLSQALASDEPEFDRTVWRNLAALAGVEVRGKAKTPPPQLYLAALTAVMFVATEKSTAALQTVLNWYGADLTSIREYVPAVGYNMRLSLAEQQKLAAIEAAARETPEAKTRPAKSPARALEAAAPTSGVK